MTDLLVKLFTSHAGTMLEVSCDIRGMFNPNLTSINFDWSLLYDVNKLGRQAWDMYWKKIPEGRNTLNYSMGIQNSIRKTCLMLSN